MRKVRVNSKSQESMGATQWPKSTKDHIVSFWHPSSSLGVLYYSNKKIKDYFSLTKISIGHWTRRSSWDHNVLGLGSHRSFFPLMNAQCNDLWCCPVKTCSNPHEGYSRWSHSAVISLHSLPSAAGRPSKLQVCNVQKQIQFIIRPDVAHMSTWDNNVLFSYIWL